MSDSFSSTVPSGVPQTHAGAHTPFDQSSTSGGKSASSSLWRQLWVVPSSVGAVWVQRWTWHHCGPLVCGGGINIPGAEMYYSGCFWSQPPESSFQLVLEAFCMVSPQPGAGSARCDWCSVFALRFRSVFYSFCVQEWLSGSVFQLPF